MPEDKVLKGLAGIGAGLLIYNGVNFASDIACRMHNPDCSYEFEAVAFTSTASDTGMALSFPSATIVTMVSS